MKTKTTNRTKNGTQYQESQIMKMRKNKNESTDKDMNTKTISPRIEFKFLNNNLSNLLLLIIFHTYLSACVD